MQKYRLRSDITNGIKKQQQTSAHAVLQQPQPQRSCTTDNGEALAVQVTIRVEVEAADFDLYRDYVPDSVSFPPSLPPFLLLSQGTAVFLLFLQKFNPGSIPTGFSHSTAHSLPAAPWRWLSEPGRRAEICSPGKGRNVKITPEEDANNGHPEDLRSQTVMPLHNRKKQKAHSNAHPGLTTLWTVSYSLFSRVKKKTKAYFFKIKTRDSGIIGVICQNV